MSETIDSYFSKGTTYMDDALDRLGNELLKIRAGKASASMLHGIMVELYGTMNPISQVANLNTVDAKTLSIQPWDKKALAPIEQAIFAANLGLTPQNDGEFIRITIPPMTEERRKDLVKQCKSLAEDAKISLRSARHKLIEFVKTEVKEGYPEDAGKRKEKEAQDLLDGYSKKIEALIAAKEKDIMTV